MTRSLTRFVITPQGDDYHIELETDDGGSFDLIASFEQLDQLAEEIDRRLDTDQDQEQTLPG